MLGVTAAVAVLTVEDCSYESTSSSSSSTRADWREPFEAMLVVSTDILSDLHDSTATSCITGISTVAVSETKLNVAVTVDAE
jgi:hypothetical protein